MSYTFATAEAQPALIQAKVDEYHEVLSDSITLASNMSELSGDSVFKSTLTSDTLNLITKNVILQQELLLKHSGSNISVTIRPNLSANGSIGSQIDSKWDVFILAVQELKRVIKQLLTERQDSLVNLLPILNNFARLELLQSDIDSLDTSIYPRLAVGVIVYQKITCGVLGHVEISDTDVETIHTELDVPPLYAMGQIYDIRNNIIVIHPANLGTSLTWQSSASFPAGGTAGNLSILHIGQTSPIFVNSSTHSPPTIDSLTGQDVYESSSATFHNCMTVPANRSSIPPSGLFLSEDNLPPPISVLSTRTKDVFTGSTSAHLPGINIGTSVATINNTVESKTSLYTSNHTSIFGFTDSANPNNSIVGIIQNMQTLIRQASIANSYFQSLPSDEQKALGFKDPVLTTLHKLATTPEMFPETPPGSGVFSGGNLFLDILHKVSKDKSTILITEDTKELLTTIGDGTTRTYTLSEAIPVSDHDRVTVTSNGVVKKIATKNNGIFNIEGVFGISFDNPYPSRDIFVDGLITQRPESIDPEISPTVFGQYPAINSSGVSTFTGVLTPIAITFKKRMNSSTINTDTFIITEKSTGDILSGTIVYEDNTDGYAGSVVKFFTDSVLNYDSTYTITLGTGVTDDVGNPLESNFSYDFTTFSGNSDTLYFIKEHTPKLNDTITVISEEITTTIDTETRSASFSESIIGENGLNNPSGFDQLNTLLSLLLTANTNLSSSIKALEINPRSANYENAQPVNIALKSLWSLFRA